MIETSFFLLFSLPFLLTFGIQETYRLTPAVSTLLFFCLCIEALLACGEAFSEARRLSAGSICIILALVENILQVFKNEWKQSKSRHSRVIFHFEPGTKSVKKCFQVSGDPWLVVGEASYGSNGHNNVLTELHVVCNTDYMATFLLGYFSSFKTFLSRAPSYLYSVWSVLAFSFSVSFYSTNQVSPL